ncbi:MAG: cation diffusion facilitator family transporter [Muribaculaceae bacterium]|nr:cation diffusion facilitator family transporter [Muribaculaceae bacterium]
MKDREKQIYRVTLLGTIVNISLVILKLAGGIIGRSSAMIADAIHSISDFLTDIIVLIFVRIAGKPRDQGHDYGHGKFETLATLIIGCLLSLAGIALMIEGIEKVAASINGQELPRPTLLALIAAVVSICAKEWLYRYTVMTGKHLNSQAVIANAWHHRSDAISSIGTLIGIAGAMFLGEKYRILDPIAAIIVSIFIIKSGYDIMKPCFAELLEASLPPDVEQEILKTVKNIDGIKYVHNLRTRRIGNNIAIDLHAKMNGDMSLNEAHAIATKAEQAIREKWGKDSFINIHMEPINK